MRWPLLGWGWHALIDIIDIKVQRWRLVRSGFSGAFTTFAVWATRDALPRLVVDLHHLPNRKQDFVQTNFLWFYTTNGKITKSKTRFCTLHLLGTMICITYRRMGITLHLVATYDCGGQACSCALFKRRFRQVRTLWSKNNLHHHHHHHHHHQERTGQDRTETDRW